MSLTKSQILRKLKSQGLQVSTLGNSAFYIPSKTPAKTLNQILGMFTLDGGKPSQKSPYSVLGEVRVGSYQIVTTIDKYRPKFPGNITAPNKSVKNRLILGTMITDVLHHAIKPLTIIFTGGKRVTIEGVTGVKFSGDGVSDFNLLKGNKKIPLAVVSEGGTYRHEITGPYLENAYDALEKVTMDGDIDASMTGDTMTLNVPIVFEADTRSIRELLFQDIRGGLGVVGTFKSTDFSYDGKTNTLTIICNRTFVNPVDLKVGETPYFVIVNGRGKISDVKGLQLDLVPRNSLPNRITMANL